MTLTFKSPKLYAAPAVSSLVTRSVNHRDLEKRCHEDAHAIKRAPETTRNVAISRKGNPPIRDIAISLEHACEIGTNMARTERNISLKGASSPLLKHHDRLTAEHSVSAIGAQELAVSTASCAVARAALDVRALAAGRSALASERPFSAPFSAPSYLYSHATAAQTLLL